ncbi:MAG: B12-binding domain-containing radical SAM protein [Acidobacteria bacterium]|nr:B12-binding domain-containing radical SAM protein [Acidobacteriota bacterium]MBI3428143.1 B12-binding domain-containing radical SAM protein [Acidobacteriota bacterium]
MRVLLVYPEFPDTYWSFRHALSFEGKRSAFPPLGLLTVAALLPQAWERRLVDMNVQALKTADIAWAELVFVSAMLTQKEALARVIARCKALGKRVVVGGPYATTSAAELPEADHLFLGEAETTLPEFVRDLERGAAKRIYEAAERPALALTPLPDFKLAELSKYSALSVQFSRGCPFQCEFCDIIEIYGRAPRTKSNAQMLAELDVLFDLGWRGMVFIVDDNFIGNKRNVKKFLPELAEWSTQHGQPFSFITEASVNLADDDELLAGMQRAGFRRVFLGIETPVEASLIEAQKGQNTRGDLLASVQKIQRYGMEVMAGFIVGFDNDPPDIFARQIEFIRASAIPLAMVGLLTALPQTQLWRRLEREGRLLMESTGNNTDGTLNFIPKMEATRLLAGYQTILRTIYSPGEYYQRALDSLARVTVGSKEPRRTGFLSDVVTLARVVLALGVRDPARGAFWRYLRQAFIAHRAKFAEAVRLAALGYHFRKLTEGCSKT